MNRWVRWTTASHTPTSQHSTSIPALATASLWDGENRIQVWVWTGWVHSTFVGQSQKCIQAHARTRQNTTPVKYNLPWTSLCAVGLQGRLIQVCLSYSLYRLIFFTITSIGILANQGLSINDAWWYWRFMINISCLSLFLPHTYSTSVLWLHVFVSAVY